MCETITEIYFIIRNHKFYSYIDIHFMSACDNGEGCLPGTSCVHGLCLGKFIVQFELYISFLIVRFLSFDQYQHPFTVGDECMVDSDCGNTNKVCRYGTCAGKNICIKFNNL